MVSHFFLTSSLIWQLRDSGANSIPDQPFENLIASKSVAPRSLGLRKKVPIAWSWGPFPIIEAHDQQISEFIAVQERRGTDFQALKL